MPNRTSLNTQYAVTPGHDITITVLFGNGQFGTSIIRIGKKTTIGDLAGFVMGKGSTLKGKTATLKSIVTDVNDKTNNVSATYSISGGPQTQDFVLDSVVENEGDSERFSVEIAFI